MVGVPGLMSWVKIRPPKDSALFKAMVPAKVTGELAPAKGSEGVARGRPLLATSIRKSV